MEIELEKFMIKMSLFGLIYCCDEGFHGFDEVFKANSRQDVLEFMLKEIKEYIYAKKENKQHSDKYIKGNKYATIFLSSNWNIYNDDCIDWKIKEESRLQFLENATTSDLEKIINESYVNGDSHFQIFLTKVRPTVDLIK